MLRLSILAAAAIAGGHPTAASKLEPFNQSFTAAIRKMDNAAVLALWEDDGIALLPHSAPLIGKAAIGQMMERATAPHPKARMESFTNNCSGARVDGNWASEWCLEHQIVGEDGKTMFDGWGKVLLVLHRNSTGNWRLSREMWNEADAPTAAKNEAH